LDTVVKSKDEVTVASPHVGIIINNKRSLRILFSALLLFNIVIDIYILNLINIF